MAEKAKQNMSKHRCFVTEHREVQGHSKDGRDPETSLTFRSEISHCTDGHKSLSLE